MISSGCISIHPQLQLLGFWGPRKWGVTLLCCRRPLWTGMLGSSIRFSWTEDSWTPISKSLGMLRGGHSGSVATLGLRWGAHELLVFGHPSAMSLCVLT